MCLRNFLFAIGTHLCLFHRSTFMVFVLNKARPRSLKCGDLNSANCTSRYLRVRMHEGRLYCACCCCRHRCCIPFNWNMISYFACISLCLLFISECTKLVVVQTNLLHNATPTILTIPFNFEKKHKFVRLDTIQ
jgi:hypothetical protein